MLHRIIYASTISPTAAASLVSTMEDILLASVRNNLRDDITGFLICDGFCFAQVLEGQKGPVEACFTRILADRRHIHPLLRERTGVETRRFPSWSMCGLTLSAEDDALLRPPDIDFDLRRAPGGALLQVLSGAADRYSRRLDAAHDRLLGMVRGA